MRGQATLKTLILYAVVAQVLYFSLRAYRSTVVSVDQKGSISSESEVPLVEGTRPIEDPLANTLRKQVLRLQGVEKACRSQPLLDVPTKASDFASLIVDTKHRLMFCLVAKIGSTSWTTMFFNQLGYPNLHPGKTIGMINAGKTPLHYIHKLNATESQRVLREYYGFVYGRNPWRRLLSGYNDKFEDKPDRKIIHEMWGKNIIKTFRKNATEYALQHGNDVTFPEFIAWIVEDIKAGKTLDIHWKSIDQVCHLCRQRYSFLGHLEDLEEEKPLLLPLAFREANFTAVPEVHRKRKADHDDQLTRAYREIPQEHRDVLLNYYKVDFEVFGYPKEIPGL